MDLKRSTVLWFKNGGESFLNHGNPLSDFGSGMCVSLDVFEWVSLFTYSTKYCYFRDKTMGYSHWAFTGRVWYTVCIIDGI